MEMSSSLDLLNLITEKTDRNVSKPDGNMDVSPAEKPRVLTKCLVGKATLNTIERIPSFMELLKPEALGLLFSWNTVQLSSQRNSKSLSYHSPIKSR
jgi:hypothetical protein